MSNVRTAQQRQDLTILIVDDDALMRRLLVLHLQMAIPRAKLFEAATGESALALIAARKPDLIVLDGHLPTVSGAEVAATLRRNPRFENIPIIGFTAAGRLSPLMYDLRQYCDVVFSKTDRMEQVRAMARRMLLLDGPALPRPADNVPTPPPFRTAPPVA